MTPAVATTADRALPSVDGVQAALDNRAQRRVEQGLPATIADPVHASRLAAAWVAASIERQR